MNDEQLLRYSRHILLPEFGIEGQQRLLESHALLIGAGGLGSPAALYLASAGVGTLTVCDGDVVDLTNLQRQIVHREAAIGRPKAESARETLQTLNAETRIHAVAERVEGARLQVLVAEADVVLDASDNFATRHAVNRACVAAGKPLVSGAGVRFDGQLAVFDLRAADAPCYACLFPEDGEQEETRCAVMGVFSPLVGIVGAMQAAEALKLLAGAGTSMSGRLLLIDALAMELRTVKLARDAGCGVCARR
ncbi:MAG: HesA/MoeB/ThiF family protein [Betaproteobacteria bacterium]|jgi:molybdopterin/thiamine biosynthesis adenylyltransferase|nr:HesA/MoeB/ThiF family protein [Betaproteobacteria bacterium]